MNATGLKARIRNIAKNKNVPAQVILQNYMFERFLERLSISDYKDKFVLKGGMLISTIVGISARTTMDLDVTLRGYKLSDESIRKAVSDICAIKIDDDIVFRLLGVDVIRKDDKYGGLRIALEAEYERVMTPLSIDVTSGDVITPCAVRRDFVGTFDEKKKIELWTYNIETVLAEKVETILRRGVFNTRMRDFYDVYILATTQEYDREIFTEALRATMEHRKTTCQIADVPKILDFIEESKELSLSWERYRREYPYAENITFDEVIRELERHLMG